MKKRILEFLAVGEFHFHSFFRFYFDQRRRVFLSSLGEVVSYIALSFLGFDTRVSFSLVWLRESSE